MYDNDNKKIYISTFWNCFVVSTALPFPRRLVLCSHGTRFMYNFLFKYTLHDGEGNMTEIPKS